MTLPATSHASNRRAFATADASDPVFGAYCALVALELALKDHDAGCWKRRHDVPEMVRVVFPGDAGLAELATFLERELGALYCTGTKGLPEPVKGTDYPGLRYVRRAPDCPVGPGVSRDQDILQVRARVTDIMNDLARKGLRL